MIIDFKERNTHGVPIVENVESKILFVRVMMALSYNYYMYQLLRPIYNVHNEFEAINRHPTGFEK
jgi:hypothetical protein